MGGGGGLLVPKLFRKVVLDSLANLMRKLRGGGTLSRSSHLNYISWETRGVSSRRKCFKQGKKGVV